MRGIYNNDDKIIPSLTSLLNALYEHIFNDSELIDSSHVVHKLILPLIEFIEKGELINIQINTTTLIFNLFLKIVELHNLALVSAVSDHFLKFFI